MSRTRRVICVFVGLFMLVMGGLLGFTSQLMTSRFAVSAAEELTHEVLDKLESSGTTFSDRDQARGAIFGAIWNDLSKRNGVLGFYCFALCGLAPIAFGVYPSRKPKQSV